MCRIVGYWDQLGVNSDNSQNIICSMRDTMITGGPDDAGYYLDSQHNLAFGHRRLSIIDLSQSGHQPMIDTDTQRVIIFNGEIYNFKEIQKELEQFGYIFRSTSDTEVILKAYDKWGIHCVNKFRGMWAFAIWDKLKEQLILCRDRVGVKPLYYYYCNGLFMFASELKAFYKYPKFQKNINLDALSLYFQYGYIPAPYSIFNNTKKLEPGCYLTITSNGQIQTSYYWNMEDYYIKGANEYAHWLKQGLARTQDDLEQVLIDSFKLRLVSDVPVGIFLSGGIDSSLVTAILQKQVNYKLKTFTIGFQDKRFNEANYAKQVAEYIGTEHHELYCTPRDLTDLIDTMAYAYDEPFGDSSAIPTLLLSKFASKHVKVALSADGGDEQFFGYNAYSQYLSILKFKSLFASIGQISKYNGLVSILNMLCREHRVQKILKILNTISLIDVYSLLGQYFLDADVDKLLLNENHVVNHSITYNSTIDIKNQVMLKDIKTYLPDDILVKTDRASMAFGLESREPLLDNKILEYSAQLPFNYKYKNNCKKYILKNILYKYIPKALVNRPKTGFGVPIETWFKEDLKPLLLEYLNPNHISKEKVLNSNYIEFLTNQYYNGNLTNFNKLWLIFSFEKWKEANM